MIFIVSFELAKPEVNSQKLLGLIKSAQSWARLNKSSFLIESNKEAVELRNLYKTALETNDSLYIGIAMAPAAWINMPNDVSEWIVNRLKHY